MMKRANIDAVRTSHYPPHPEFLRLCDEYGLWVVVECDLETHGFIYAGWDGQSAGGPGVARRAPRPDAAHGRTRQEPPERRHLVARRTRAGPAPRSARSSAGSASATVATGALRARPELPQLGLLLADVPVARAARADRAARGAGARRGSPTDEDARRRGLPFLLIEYAHAMGNGPGSLQDYWRIMAAHDRLCGGFVWEWIDHGFTPRRPTACRSSCTATTSTTSRAAALQPARAGLQRPHADARARRAGEGLRAGRDRGRRRRSRIDEHAAHRRHLRPRLPVVARGSTARGRATGRSTVPTRRWPARREIPMLPTPLRGIGPAVGDARARRSRRCSRPTRAGRPAGHVFAWGQRRSPPSRAAPAAEDPRSHLRPAGDRRRPRRRGRSAARAGGVRRGDRASRAPRRPGARRAVARPAPRPDRERPRPGRPERHRRRCGEDRAGPAAAPHRRGGARRRTGCA